MSRARVSPADRSLRLGVDCSRQKCILKSPFNFSDDRGTQQPSLITRIYNWLFVNGTAVNQRRTFSQKSTHLSANAGDSVQFGSDISDAIKEDVCFRFGDVALMLLCVFAIE